MQITLHWVRDVSTSYVLLVLNDGTSFLKILHYDFVHWPAVSTDVHIAVYLHFLGDCRYRPVQFIQKVSVSLIAFMQAIFSSGYLLIPLCTSDLLKHNVFCQYRNVGLLSSIFEVFALLLI